jgi:hypothetical protein
MTHLFMEMQINLEENTDEECLYTVKRSGTAAILLNLSYFEPETVQRTSNEIFLLLANQHLISTFAIQIPINERNILFSLSIMVHLRSFPIRWLKCGWHKWQLSHS